ncbi:MAG: hypothetical protein Q8N81_00555, partial [bacterium]|nr:hypothetical protein [bacterium]
MNKASKIFLYGFLILGLLCLGFIFSLSQKAEAVGTKSLGEDCESSAECFSYYCNNGLCDCYANGYDNCFYPSHCCSGVCQNNTCVQRAECENGETRCVEEIIDEVIKGKTQECVNGAWELQNYCAGTCKADGKTCDDSVEEYDASCATIDSNVQPGGISFQPQGTSCSKNGFSGACDGSGHCEISPDPGCFVTLLSGERVPQGSGVVCFIGETNGTCDGQGNCVIGGGGDTPPGGGGDTPYPETCCNNIDDDLDGMIDAQDSDCNQSKGTISLQAGTNNVCWQAKPWGMLSGSESQYDYTSPTFSCPTGYWVKLTGDYLIRDFEELYLIYPGGQTLPYGYGAGTQMPSGAGSLNSIFRASQLSLRYNSGGGKQAPFTNLALQQLGVLVSSVECVAEAASNDCGSCGDNGIFDGLLNPCDMNECYEIGDGPFYTGEGQCFYQPSTLGGQCYNKSPVDFLVRDAISQTPLAGVKVDIYSYDYLNCTTGSDGKCQIDLALGASFTAFVTGDNLDCQTPNCRKYFTPTLIPE